MTKLWKIYVPLENNEQKDEWIESVIELAGGLSNEGDHAAGLRVDPEGKVHKDQHSVFLVMADRPIMKETVNSAKVIFNQTAVFYYLVSEKAYIHA